MVRRAVGAKQPAIPAAAATTTPHSPHAPTAAAAPAAAAAAHLIPQVPQRHRREEGVDEQQQVVDRQPDDHTPEVRALRQAGALVRARQPHRAEHGPRPHEGVAAEHRHAHHGALRQQRAPAAARVQPLRRVVQQPEGEEHHVVHHQPRVERVAARSVVVPVGRHDAGAHEHHAEEVVVGGLEARLRAELPAAAATPAMAAMAAAEEVVRPIALQLGAQRELLDLERELPVVLGDLLAPLLLLLPLLPPLRPRGDDVVPRRLRRDHLRFLRGGAVPARVPEPLLDRSMRSTRGIVDECLFTAHFSE